MKLPTDQQILEKIYEIYAEDFKDFVVGRENQRRTKVFVPIDCKLIADRLNTDGDIIFGRLYYHMEGKYGYIRKDEKTVSFFEMQVANDHHCINFPLMAAVLSGMRTETDRVKVATYIATFAAIVAIFGVVTQVLAAL